MHNFISSGFVTLGRGHLKGKVHPRYLFLTSRSPENQVQNNHISLTKPLCHAVILFLPNECGQDCDFCFSSVEVGHYNT